MKNIVTHIALPSMWSLPSLYPFVLDIGCRRHLVYLLRTSTSSYIDCLMTFSFSWWFSNIDIAQRLCRCFLAFTGRHLPCHTCIHYQLSRQRSTKMTTPAHRLLDHLLDDLKKELFAKMQQNIVLELEKRKRDLQSMVENMLEERRTEMLKVLWMKQSTPTPTTLRSVWRSRWWHTTGW